MSSRVSDDALLELLADDRLAQRVERVHEVLREEQTWLASVGNMVWYRLSVLPCSPSPKEMRSTSMLCAAISGAFFWRRALRVANDYPWRLCVGDLESNLDRLAEMDDPPSGDATTRNIHTPLGPGIQPSEVDGRFAEVV